ncbi:MAG TPA: ATP-binding protein, partial [Magnetospirillum sp.]|nr:ATP-binding protein [Magnetospirillum sp.]
RQPGREDELDRVVAAFNGMCVSLERAYADLRDANQELEKDIEARKEAEAEITRLNAVLEQRVRQRTAELEAANNELASFSYSVSHDLRAPLRRIEGFARILLEETGSHFDERGEHCVNRIQAGTREMSEMVDSFLRLSRTTRGELALEQVDLSSVVQSVVAELAEKEPDRAVAVHIQPGLSIQGDRRLLKSALVNLFENAWKYTRRTSVPEVWFGRNADGAFFVRDNGVGFDQSFAGRLFIPFNRLHKPEEYEGIGIGLATVQRIIARHGGRVWAEGVSGQGATILFTCWEGENA